jgi:hypothetical protein
MHKLESVQLQKSTLYDSIKNYQNFSKENVEETMSRMDSLNKTSFKKWIKDEDNVNYLCITKREMILGYIDENLESAMYALEWMIEGWSVESTAELILKLFYSAGLKSNTFCSHVHRLAKDWEVEKIQQLLSILLVGESCSVIAHFFANWIFQSNWNSEDMALLVVPLADTFKWTMEQYGVFLISLSSHLIVDATLKETMFIMIQVELETAVVQGRNLLNYFELLLQVVIEESHVLK